MLYASVGQFGITLNIKPRTDTTDSELIRYWTINLINTKTPMIVITTTMTEVLKIYSTTIIVKSSSRYLKVGKYKLDDKG